MNKKIIFICEYFILNSHTSISNIKIFTEYISSLKTTEEINQLYLYTKYCNKYSLAPYFYFPKPALRFGLSRSEFQLILSLTELLNHFNFDTYSSCKIFKIIFNYLLPRVIHVRLF